MSALQTLQTKQNKTKHVRENSLDLILMVNVHFASLHWKVMLFSYSRSFL